MLLLDGAFLGAEGKVQPAAGIAVGLDRVLMRLLGAGSLAEAPLLPAQGFV